MFYSVHYICLTNKDQAWSCFDPTGVVHVDIVLEIQYINFWRLLVASAGDTTYATRCWHRPWGLSGETSCLEQALILNQISISCNRMLCWYVLCLSIPVIRLLSGKKAIFSINLVKHDQPLPRLGDSWPVGSGLVYMLLSCILDILLCLVICRTQLNLTQNPWSNFWLVDLYFC